MSWIVTQHPTPAMEEHEYRQVAVGAYWTYHTNIQGFTLNLDAAALDLDT